jgi:hypothetical protein
MLSRLRRPLVVVDAVLSGQYGGAMAAAQQAVEELAQLRARDASPAELHVVHHRLDGELATAAAAAGAVYDQLMAAGKNSLRTERRPEVEFWKRRMNTALTLRSRHQLKESDDGGSRAHGNAHVRTRAAYGPHQPGMDFDNEPA